MAAQAAKERDDITVLPGVEASVVGGQLGSSRIHFLAIFPPNTRASQIDRIYSKHADPTPYPADEDRTGKEEFKLDGTLAEWQELIRRQAGIFIAAHIDEPRTGLRARFRATREGSLGFERTGSGSEAPTEVVKQVSEEFLGYIIELAPDAVEITNPNDRKELLTRRLQCGSAQVRVDAIASVRDRLGGLIYCLAEAAVVVASRAAPRRAVPLPVRLETSRRRGYHFMSVTTEARATRP